MAHTQIAVPTRNPFALTLGAVMLSAALAGCGSGGGNEASSASTDTVVLGSTMTADSDSKNSGASQVTVPTLVGRAVLSAATICRECSI